jgi:quercetin dioxygenase-like cupin family protein
MSLQPSLPTDKGPADWFTGDVWIDTIVPAHEGWPVTVASVHFTPGARTAWHSHEGGQTLYVTEGQGLAQSRDGEVVELRVGDTHFTPDGEVHWHGATPDCFLTHMAINQGPPTWGEHVTDDEYQQRS